MSPPLTTSMTGPGDDALLLLELLDRAPGPLVLGPLLRQDEAAVLVLLLEDQRLELLAERHDLGRVDVVADRELPRRDHAFGLEPDVEQDLVVVDLDDGAADQAALVELDDGGVDRVGERHVAEVVEDDDVVLLGLAGVLVGGGAGVGGGRLRGVLDGLGGGDATHFRVTRICCGRFNRRGDRGRRPRRRAAGSFSS